MAVLLPVAVIGGLGYLAWRYLLPQPLPRAQVPVAPPGPNPLPPPNPQQNPMNPRPPRDPLEEQQDLVAGWGYYR